MTELEKIRHAHNYILNLANGVDPISGQELSSDTCLSNVRLSRCFFYVADVLRQVIENGGNVGKFQGGEFVLTDEFRAKLTVSAHNVQITEFVKPISAAAHELGMKNIPVTAFTGWLVDEGYLAENIINDKRRKEPTSKGAASGIITEEKNNQYGTYKAVLYNTAAQQFMIDNIDKIVERWKNK